MHREYVTVYIIKWHLDKTPMNHSCEYTCSQLDKNAFVLYLIVEYLIASGRITGPRDASLITLHLVHVQIDGTDGKMPDEMMKKMTISWRQCLEQEISSCLLFDIDVFLVRHYRRKRLYFDCLIQNTVVSIFVSSAYRTDSASPFIRICHCYHIIRITCISI